MKIYRLSILKTESAKDVVYTLVTVIIISVLAYLYTDYFSVIVSVGFIAILFFIACTATQFFYVVQTESEIMVKNPIYRFWSISRHYEDLEKVEIGYAGGYTRPYIRLKIHGRWFSRRVIELVDVDDYADLIQTIEARGIPVETPNLELYLKYRLKK